MPRETEIPDDTVTCVSCGWVSYSVTREHAEEHVARHNARRAIDLEALRHWPRPMSIREYACRGCGGWGPYRPARQGDCPVGCTINAVVVEAE